MPKRLLIVADAFTRPLYGPRMTQLCKYLSASGWNITLITERINGDDYVVPNCRFLAMLYYSANPIVRHLQWLADKLFDGKDRRLYAFYRKKLCAENFSLILCSSFNLFPLPAAYRIAQERHLPLVVDLRDIIEQWNSDSYIASNIHLSKWFKRKLVRLYEKKCIRKRNFVLQYADCVTTISPWHQQFLQAFNPNTHLIYNGFDHDKYFKKNEKSEQFVISYTGRLYDFKSRNPQLFLEAICNLHAARLISKKSLQIEFHIEQCMVAPLQEWVNRLGIEEYFSISNYVSRDDALSLLQRSSVSLIFVAAPSSMAPHGVMTTKFFEALGCEKPVLCVPSDEGCLADVIRQTNAGVAAASVAEIEQFILEKYHEWQQFGYTHQPVNQAEKAKFSRQYQARQFEELFLELL